MKTCTRCKQLKDLEEFNFNARGKEGRSTQCKQCRSEIYQIRKKKDRNKLLNQWRDYYKRNRTKRLLSDRQRSKRDAEKIREQDRARYQKNRKKQLKRSASWRARNKLSKQASNKLRALLANGLVEKASRCSKCGERGTEKFPLEAYQPFKTMPAHVLWMHRACKCQTLSQKKGTAPIVCWD